MAKPELRNKAIEMRKKGMSFNAIKEEIGVSKGTLSIWLKDMPLTSERINELRGSNEQRIERYRNTRRIQHEDRLYRAYKDTAKTIGFLSHREIFLTGLFLYWAEGTKASPGVVTMTNTDPMMIQFFITWLKLEKISDSKMQVRLHLYSDMDIEKETRFWERNLNLPRSNFKKPYIKESIYEKRRNYKGRFGHGTCNLMISDVILYEKIMMGIKYLGDSFSKSGLSDPQVI